MQGCNAGSKNVLSIIGTHGLIWELPLEGKYHEDTLCACRLVSPPGCELTAVMLPPWGLILESATGRVLYQWPCRELMPGYSLSSCGPSYPPAGKGSCLLLVQDGLLSSRTPWPHAYTLQGPFKPQGLLAAPHPLPFRSEAVTCVTSSS